MLSRTRTRTRTRLRGFRLLESHLAHQRDPLGDALERDNSNAQRYTRWLQSQRRKEWSSACRTEATALLLEANSEFARQRRARSRQIQNLPGNGGISEARARPTEAAGKIAR
jgi:hypothetical protein